MSTTKKVDTGIAIKSPTPNSQKFIIPDASVSTAKLADDSVTPDKLMSNGVNLVINGGMDFFQRGGKSSSVGIGGGFSYQTADRHAIGHNAGDKTSQSTQRSTDVPDNDLTRYSIHFESTHTGSAGDMLLRHRVESENCRQVANKKASLSFWLKSDSADTVDITINRANTVDNFGAITQLHFESQTAPTDGSWNRYIVEGVDIPEDGVNGIEVIIGVRNFVNTAGTRNHYMTQIMLTEGPKAQEFQRHAPSIGLEFKACERYYETSFDVTFDPANGPSAGNFATLQGLENVPIMTWTASPILTDTTVHFKTTKRVQPTLTKFGDLNGNWTYSVIGTFVLTNARTPNALISFNTFGTDKFGLVNNVSTSALLGVQGHWAASAEL